MAAGFDPLALYTTRYGVDFYSGLGYNLIYGNAHAGYLVLGLVVLLILLAVVACRYLQEPIPQHEEKKLNRKGQKK